MVAMSHQLLMPQMDRAIARPPSAGHAEVLDAWLGTGTRLTDSSETSVGGGKADWEARRCPVELAYDTADQGLPSGVRAVVREGSRRLMFEAEAYEILLRVASNLA